MLATVRSAPWFPGAVAPSYLTGELAGDVGFDPYGMVALAPTAASVDGPEWSGADRKAKMIMATDYEKHKKVMWMREAEMKHSRLAMMAAAGWPLSELLDKPLSQAFGLPYALEATNGRAPSLFNGHLFDGPSGVFLVLVTIATAVLEVSTLDNAYGLTPTGYEPGDLGFDPLGLGSMRKDMKLAEIKNGRLAMLAVTGAQRACPPEHSTASALTPRKQRQLPRHTRRSTHLRRSCACLGRHGGAGVYLRDAGRAADAAILPTRLLLSSPRIPWSRNARRGREAAPTQMYR